MALKKPVGPGPDEMARISLNIVNQERQELEYWVRPAVDGQPATVRVDDQPASELGPVTLPDKGKWDMVVAYLPPKAPGRYVL